MFSMSSGQGQVFFSGGWRGGGGIIVLGNTISDELGTNNRTTKDKQYLEM